MMMDDAMHACMIIWKSSTSGSRNRRNVQFTTICEPRFAEQMQNEGSHVLTWICPSGEEPPTDEEESSLCDPLLSSGYIQTCQPPVGELMTITQPETLPET